MKSPFESFFDDAASAAKEALKVASDTATNVVGTVGSTANDALSVAGQGLDEARKFAAGTASSVADAVGSTANSAISVVSQNIENQRQKAAESKQRMLDEAEAARQANIAKLDDPSTLELLEMLGDTPIPTTEDNIKKIKDSFPIPCEQDILWADVEFDLRPSGIVATNKGVFVKSDAAVFANPFAKESGETQISSLYLIAWEYFDPQCFTLDDSGNYALAVDK